MPIDISAILSGLAALGVGIDILVNVRAQRDLAQLEIRVLNAINGKYISRNEHVEIEKNRDKWQDAADRKISETRERHHDLHEEFIACRAAHQAKGA
jgi:hypothetical protein